MNQSLSNVRVWRKAMSQFCFAASMSGLFAHAQANSGAIDSKYFEIGSVQVGIKNFNESNVITSNHVQEYSLKEWKHQQVLQKRNREALLKRFQTLNQVSDGISIDQIINFGARLWKIIEENKPVASLTSVSANALPKSAQGDWLAMDNWQSPRGQIYSISYKNLYGMEVVNFGYRLLFSPGGSLDGKGLYLNNVTVNPQPLTVVWGYNVEATSKVLNVLNVGSRTNPVAGMELLVEWHIKTVVKDTRASASYFVQGDGSFADLNGSP